MYQKQLLGLFNNTVVGHNGLVTTSSGTAPYRIRPVSAFTDLPDFAADVRKQPITQGLLVLPASLSEDPQLLNHAKL